MLRLRLAPRTARMPAPSLRRAACTLPAPPQVYRSLLRNMALLQGLRAEQDTFNVIFTGLGSTTAARVCSELEPRIRARVVGDGVRLPLDELKELSGAKADGVIVSQVYHTLQSASDVAVLRSMLDDEAGALGFTWVRALPSLIVDAYGQALQVEADATGGASRSANDSALPRLAPGQTPMLWVDALRAKQYDLHPLKHRKSIDTVADTPANLARMLRTTHDARPLGASEAAIAAAEAAFAAALASPGAKSQIAFDLHAFHAKVVPRA